MLFNSIEFLVFFSIVVAAYFSIPASRRWILLLAASCYFYMVFIPEYVLILLFVNVVDWASAIALEETAGARRRWLLAASLLSNIGVLAVFKYFGFFGDNLDSMLAAAGLDLRLPRLGIILPIGLSFHTFQSMGYVLEVYYGRQKAQRHFGRYSVYVLFFPQLVAGPIERSQSLMPQLAEAHRFDSGRLTLGLQKMLWGFFQKIVIADRLAVLVDQVYKDPGGHSGPQLLLATYFFAFQIYCDFNGYCDIAVGAAQILGIRLMENFRRPYFSKSVPEFWHRWHISLSSWFRDYLYIPLGGNRVSKLRWHLNLLFVFLVSGFWHGANWTFVLWGALHGSYLLLSVWTAGLRERLAEAAGLAQAPGLRKLVRVLITFHLVVLAWIPFRAPTIADAWLILRKILDVAHWPGLLPSGVIGAELGPVCFSLGVLLAVHWVERREDLREALARVAAPLRWGAYAALLLCTLWLGKFDHQSFIYFQF